jgi:hypothetical protein
MLGKNDVFAQDTFNTSLSYWKENIGWFVDEVSVDA